MSGLSISELEFYSLPELVEVYRTIDRENNPIKTSVMEKQIRIRMNLSASADLSNENIQKQFDQILLDYAPIKLIKEKNKKIVNKLRKVQLLLFLLFLIVFVIMFNYTEYINGLDILFFADIGILAIIEFVQSLYSGQISAGSASYEKENNPQLFGCMQAFVLLLGIGILFLALLLIRY